MWKLPNRPRHKFLQGLSSFSPTQVRSIQQFVKSDGRHRVLKSLLLPAHDDLMLLEPREPVGWSNQGESILRWPKNLSDGRAGYNECVLNGVALQFAYENQSSRAMLSVSDTIRCRSVISRAPSLLCRSNSLDPYYHGKCKASMELRTV